MLETPSLPQFSQTNSTYPDIGFSESVIEGQNTPSFRVPFASFKSKIEEDGSITHSDETYEDFMNDLIEAKIRQFKSLMKQLSYKAEANRGSFTVKEVMDREDYYQLYCMAVMRCCKMYFDQGEKRMDTLIRSAITAKSIDFSNARKLTQVDTHDNGILKAEADCEVFEGYIDSQNKSATWNRQKTQTASLSYHFSALESPDEKLRFDVSENDGRIESKSRTTRHGEKDYNEYRESLFSDQEVNEFFDFKDAYKSKSGKQLIGKDEISLMDVLLNLQKGDKCIRTLSERSGLTYSKTSKTRVIFSSLVCQICILQTTPANNKRNRL